jgi:hypothetical protein
MTFFTSIAVALTGAAAGSFIVAVTTGALQVAAGVGLSLIAKAIAGEPQPARFGVQARLQGGDDVPRSIIFGRTATAGSLAYHNTWGTASGVPNAFHTRVVALADYPIQSLDKVYVAELECTLLKAEPHAERGWPVEEYRKNGVDHMWVKFYDGTQTVADSFLTTRVSNAARPYPSTRVGRGVAYAIVTCMAPERKDGEEKPLFSGGPPAIKFEVTGARLYDPSKDSTVGGSGTHRWDNPSTWGGDGDHLPIVQAYNIMRGITWGGSWLYGLQSLNANRIPAAGVIPQINKCRELFEGPNGDEPQYRSGGELQVAAPIKSALEALLTSCQGRMMEIGGTYKFLVGAPDAPVFAFTDADILSTQDQHFSPFFGLEDTINGVQSTYPNPFEGWKTKTAPPLLRSDLEALDGNRRLMASVSLDMVWSIGQVERLQKSALEEAQRARRHTHVLGPEAWVLEPGDFVRWTSARNGYEDKLFRVDGIADRADLDVMVDITEVDPADYDWDFATDFTPVVDGPLQLVETPPLPMIGWQVYGVAALDNDGNARRPAIEVWYQSGLQNIEFVRVQVANEEDGEPFIDLVVNYGDPWKTQIVGNLINNNTYWVRGIFLTYDRSPAEWSEWLAVTTPDVRLTANDISIELEELAEEITRQLEWIGTGVRDVIKSLEKTGRLVAEQDLSNYDTFDQLRRSVDLQVGDLRASFDEVIEVALGPGGAIATQIGQLRAALGGNEATVNVRAEAVAAPTGYSASYAWSAAVDDGVYRVAAFGLNVPAGPDGKTQFWVNADQFIVRDGTTGLVPFAIEDGVVKFLGARFNRISSPDGVSYIDMTGNPSWHLESST